MRQSKLHQRVARAIHIHTTLRGGGSGAHRATSASAA
jgi:hypothetical protein